MRRISYVILFAVVVGIGTVSSWLYVKYFRSEPVKLPTFEVKRSELNEVVRVRGEAVASTDFNLGFAVAGTIDKMYVKEGQSVKSGDPLLRLTTNEKESEASGLRATLAAKRANLNKLLAGSTKEDIAVSETKVKNAETAYLDAQKNLIDVLLDVYTVADDAIRNYADTMMTDTQTQFPNVSFESNDASLVNAIESDRILVEKTLNDWEISVNTLSLSHDLLAASKLASANLDQIRLFLNNLFIAVSKVQVGVSVTASQASTWKTNVATARTNINAAIADVTAAVENERAENSDLALAKEELTLKLAGTRAEEVSIAQADVAKAQSDVDAANERIARSTIYAPSDGTIMNILRDVGEPVLIGETAVSLSSLQSKIEADVSELDIVKIEPGQTVEISFDAFPDVAFTGTVVSVDPEKIVKDGDKYYRVNVSFDPGETKGLRMGMSSDLKIQIQTKTGILTAPKFVFYKKTSKEYAKVLRDNKEIEVEVKTGVSDGEFVEIISGLAEGDTVVASAD